MRSLERGLVRLRGGERRRRPVRRVLVRPDEGLLARHRGRGSRLQVVDGAKILLLRHQQVARLGPEDAGHHVVRLLRRQSVGPVSRQQLAEADPVEIGVGSVVIAEHGGHSGRDDGG